jgi:enamine deaminase RidA (YjgF/YER057c/UK114 family)
MTSSRLPAAVGPYSLGRLIPLSDGSAIAFSSGQLGIDPVTNNLVSEDVAEQAE